MKIRRAMRFGCAALIAAFATLAPTQAHHTSQRAPGAPVGIAIPAITHGEMPIVARYRSEIMALATRQSPTDPTLRRLQGFGSLQYFACFWGLAPRALSDEASPFNECAHAYLAGARALLAHMVEMPGDQTAAKALQARLDAELASDPFASAICSNSAQAFDSGIVISPDWSLAPAHLPTMLTFSGLVLFASAGLGASIAIRRNRIGRSA
jgi:hypothetical protein